MGWQDERCKTCRYQMERQCRRFPPERHENEVHEPDGWVSVRTLAWYPPVGEPKQTLVGDEVQYGHPIYWQHACAEYQPTAGAA